MPASAQVSPLLQTTLDDAASVTTPARGTGLGASINTSPVNDFIVGRFSNAIRIDAALEYVRFQQIDGFTQNVELDRGTVDFWYQPFYANTDGISHRIFAIGTLSQNGSLGLYKRIAQYGNDLYFLLRDNSGINRIARVPATQYSWVAGQWVHLRLTWDSTVAAGVQNLRIFIDGSERKYATIPTGPFKMPAESVNQYIYIGSHSATENFSATGVLDEFAIYDVPIVPVVPDATPPSAAITGPAQGTVVTGTIVVSAASSDNIAVAGVQFFVDNNPIAAEDTSAPYSVPLDTTLLLDGTHALTAVARDTSNNTATSVAVDILVSNLAPPPPPVPLLYTTLDDLASVFTPAAGTSAGAQVNTSPPADFVPGQFGNGIRIDAGLEFVRFQETDGVTPNVELDKGTVDFWYQPAYAHNDGVSHRIFAVGTVRQAGSIVLYKRTGQYGNDLFFQIKDEKGVNRTVTVAGTQYAWAAGQWVHLWLTWDSTVAVGVQNMRIYIDDIERAYSSIPTGPFTMPAESATQYIYVGSTSATETLTATGPLDEFRIFIGAIPPPQPIDTAAPTVSITLPVPGSTLSAASKISASATDNVSVVGVTFFVDGVQAGAEDTFSPYTLSLDTTSMLDGAHTITAVARDGSNNSTTSSAAVYSINNANRADVVVILTDDQRFDLMQFMPLTSGLLSSETVKFDNAFATTPDCCPSRASILTGLYSHNTSVLQDYNQSGGAPSFNPSSTVATWLKDAGYRTGIYGKYLNAYYLLSPAVPPGWSEFHVFVRQNGRNSDDNYYYNYEFNDNGVVTSYGTSPQEYSTNVLATKAIQFIRSTPSNQPLFLYFTPFGPHYPATPEPQDIGSYSNFPDWRPPSFNEADVSDKPAWVQALPLLTSTQIANSDAFHRIQLETLQSVDRAVADIIAELQQDGRWSKTLLIFMSDNGLIWGEHRIQDTKFSAYEESVRVPLWVRAPGLLSRHESSIAANIDLAPTVADWAGVTPPSRVNGLSLMGLLNDPNAPWRSEILLEYLGPTINAYLRYQAVRTSQYVYVEYLSGDRELYDLAIDPFQLTNVVNDPAYAAVISTLRSLLATLKTS